MIYEKPQRNLIKSTKGVVDFVITFGLPERLPYVLYLIDYLEPFGDVHVLFMTEHTELVTKRVNCQIHDLIHLNCHLGEIYNYGLKVSRKDFVVFVSDDEIPSAKLIENLFDIVKEMDMKNLGVGKVLYKQVIDGVIYGEQAKFYAEKIVNRKITKGKCFAGDTHIIFDLSAERLYTNFWYYHYKTPNSLLFSCFWGARDIFDEEKLPLPLFMQKAKAGDTRLYLSLEKYKNYNYATKMAYLYYVCVLHPELGDEVDYTDYFVFITGQYLDALRDKEK